MQVAIRTTTGRIRSITEDLTLEFGLVVVSAGEGALGGGEQVVLDLRVVLMGQHGTVVDVQDGDDHDHQQGQQAVVVPGDLPATNSWIPLTLSDWT